MSSSRSRSPHSSYPKGGLKDTFTQDVALLEPLDLLEPAESGFPPVPLPPLAQSGDSRTLIVAPYLIDRLRFSPKLQAFIGARLDVLDPLEKNR